jgi:hypothetical protein
MGWLASFAVGLCSGVIGFVIALFSAAWATEWYRIPQREGAAGFFAFALAIFIFFGSIVLGIVCARHVAAGASSPFLKALGTTSAIIGGVAIVSLALAWLLSDPPPKMDGRRLELVIELRCPPGFTMPVLDDPTDAYATIIRLPSGDSSRWSRMDLDQSRTEEGRLVIPTVLDLDTTVPRKLLSIRLGKDLEKLFAFDFGAKPRAKDMQWSRWIEAAYRMGSAPPAAEATFHMRYRVQKEPIPPKVLTREEEEAQRLAQIRAAYQALTPEAPLAAWLDFTHYRNPEDVQKAAGAAMLTRPAFAQEMAVAMRSEDPALANLALWSFQYLPSVPPALAPEVGAVGEEIAASLRSFLQLPGDDPTRDAVAAGISRRFSDWMVATRALQAQGDLTCIPVLQEIVSLARQGADHSTIRVDVVRVASFYLHKWAGIAPLPGDPPPR